MSWTDERVEQLKKLWSDGLSASQIAAELGGNALAGLPYCAYHSRVAYQPAADRRRDRRPQR
jgi:GcrA cell cycle regulator